MAELVRTDFKLRYQGSLLGYAWSLLQPLFFFVILYLVFSFLKVNQGIPHYPVYLLIGIVLWTFFREMTTQSLTSIVGRGALIRKVRIPRWIIILSSSISATISLGFNLLILLAFLLINHVDLLMTSLWFPLILVEVYIFAVGCSLFLSALYVKYRDVSYIWDVLLQGGFYLIPIIYPISKITNLTFQKIIMINPMSQTIQGARYDLVSHNTQTVAQTFNGGLYRLVPYAIVAVAFVVGILYFRKQSRYFAEDI